MKHGFLKCLLRICALPLHVEELNTPERRIIIRLEEGGMEKKGSRSVQQASKGLALTSDSKKSSQDGVGGKPWPRSGRRREPAGGSVAAKGESSRKPAPQRTPKSYDIKRPRSRGAFNPAPAQCRAEATRLEENYETELGSVFLPGSKKQSLNHLLNFYYATPTNEGRHQSERGFDKASNRLILTRKHKYNKEHFLQANCQFVVNSVGDYKRYMNNPDALVDWHLIEQVNVQVSDYPSCPICLYPPIAAKITRCGHIYCWSCILHYLSLSDKTWRKCPICYESIHKQDLKSVVSKELKTLNVDDTITFKLMKRPKGSLITYPASAVIRDDEVFSFSEMENIDGYSKLLLANQGEILSIVEREHAELQVQLVDNGECPENCFIEQALVLLNERKDNVLKIVDADAAVVAEKLDESIEQLEINDDGETADLNISTGGQQSKFHYFYQASDGQHIYLHFLNAKMLEHCYGSLEQSPKSVTGKILEKEGGSMTEEIRKRLRYLQHLPLTCQFEVAEIQLKHPVVTKETLEHFNEQIEVRRKRRQRRAREEKKREKQIADEENRMLGKYPVPELHIESSSQFPCFEPRTRTESECTQPSEGSTDTPPNSEIDHAGPSFAKMLASSKKWPTPKVSAVVSSKQKNDCEAEEYDAAPPNRSLGEAIVQALQKAEGNISTVTDSARKKKKKNRQKVLFTTTIAYSEK